MAESFPQSAEGLRVRLQMALDACVQSRCISERQKRVVVLRLALTGGGIPLPPLVRQSVA